MNPPRHSSNVMGRTKGNRDHRAQHRHRPPPARRPREPKGAREPREPREYMTIRDLFRSSNLTRLEIERVEDALQQRERTIDERNAELEQSRDKIRVLTEDLDKAQDGFQRATDKLEDSHVAMDKLQSEHHDLQAMKELEDGLLNMGGRIIGEKSADIQELRTQLAERDSTISALNDRIIHIGMASADEAVRMANDASAMRSLKMIGGYQKTIAARDEVIKQYKESFEVLNAQLGDTEQAANEATLAADLATKQAAEAREIAEEQQALIERLLKEGPILVAR